MAGIRSFLSSPRHTGNRHEQMACQFLREQGLQLVQANYLCKLGKIDLIMTESEQFLVFIEVRHRRRNFHGSALACIDYRKQRKIRLTAAHFLLSAPQLSHYARRFHVISSGWASGKTNFEWIRAAFV